MMTFKQLLFIVAIVVIGYGLAAAAGIVYEMQGQCAVDNGNNRQDVHSCKLKDRPGDYYYLLYCVDYKGYLRAVNIPKNVCTLKKVLAKCWSGSDATEPR